MTKDINKCESDFVNELVSTKRHPFTGERVCGPKKGPDGMSHWREVEKLAGQIRLTIDHMGLKYKDRLAMQATEIWEYTGRLTALAEEMKKEAPVSAESVNDLIVKHTNAPTRARE